MRQWARERIAGLAASTTAILASTTGFSFSTVLYAVVKGASTNLRRWKGPATPKWVEIVRRGSVVFAINHGRKAVEVEVPQGKVIVGDCAKGVARLPAYGVCVVRTTARRPAASRRR